MPRVPQISPENANAQQAELLAAVKAKLGKAPNVFRAIANSPAALKGFLEFNGALATGSGLDAQQRELVALTVAEENGCEYCLAAHSTLGKMAKLPAAAIEAARRGDGVDEPSRALARFTLDVLRSRGRVTDDAIREFLEAGFDDAAIVEVVAHVALNAFSNYFNNLAQTEVDFPAAEPLAMEEACSTSCGCSA